MSLLEAIVLIKTAEAAYIYATCPLWVLFDVWLVIIILIFTGE